MPPTSPPVAYARRLGPFSATMAVIGGIIGSGIFLNPAIVAQRAATGRLTLFTWLLGGAVAVAGAFCFAELGHRRPRAGGGYVYLREAFGGLPAFLYAWALLLIIATGAIAAVAVTFASYAAPLLGLGEPAVPALAVGAIVVLSAVNYVGVAPGATVQNVFTVLKMAALLLIVVAGLGLLGAPDPPLACTPCPETVAPRGVGDTALAVGTALVPVLFAYGGWQQTNYIAEEIIEPRRNLPRALILGVGVVVTVYLLANFAYLRTLGTDGLAASSAPATETLEAYLGAAGRTVIAAGIAVSTFGFLDLVILVSPRVYQAMAKDGLFFPALARLHPRFRTPATAIVLQAAWAVLLLRSGKYGELLDWVVFGDWIFFALNAAAIFVFRARDLRAGIDPAPPGQFRVPGYPWTPAFFILASVYVLAGSVASNPRNAVLGTLLLAAGVPVYRYWSRRRAGPAG
ncbi:MAG TPA: amino acid permease [Gemmatimonadales bacterium]|nr:amino acid permease [Gemmatimonadales bacterium]